MEIGITLLYSFKQNKEAYGALKSYVIECLSFEELDEKIHEKISEQSKLYPTHKYLGVEDVFVVSGKACEGELLGRTSYYELKTKNNAIKLIEDESKYALLEQKSNEGLNVFAVKLLYFYNDKEDVDFSFVFSIITIIEALKFSQVKEKALSIATSKNFIKKIVDSSIEDLNMEFIDFVGVEDYSISEENINEGGAFYILYNKDFESEDELKDVLLSQKELKEICEDIF